jgi:diguanylate cyclase (GGDEF)-like protein/PAS domain S-box-containing protein
MGFRTDVGLVMNQIEAQQQDIYKHTLLIDIATRDVACHRRSDTLSDAVRIMADKSISSIVIVDQNNHPEGIITERNILSAMQSGRGANCQLGDIMSSPVITVSETINCLDAYRGCQRDGIRHLVIVDENNVLAGVISETDFRKHFNLFALAGRRKVSSVARKSAATLPPTAKLSQALGMMLELQKSCVVAVEHKKPIGIITERDVVRFYTSASGDPDVTLESVMIKPVLTVTGEVSCGKATEIMLRHRVRHLVVVDEHGGMIGLVSEHDLTEAMASSLSDERGGFEANFLRTLINTLPDLIWLKDKRGVYLACNARFERFVGKPESDIVGKTDYDLVDKALADSFRENDLRALERGEPTVNEEWITFADDGHRELLETVKTPMRSQNGEVIGVLGVGRDITGRKAAEIALRQSQSDLREAQRIAGLAHWQVDLASGDVYWSEELYRMLGLDVTSSPPAFDDSAKLFTEESWQNLSRAIAKTVETGTRYELELEMIKSDGSHGWMLARGEALRTISEDISGVRGIAVEITDRKRVEESLKLSDLVYQNSSEGMLVTDADNRIVAINPAFTAMTGYVADEVIGQTPAFLNSGRQDSAFYQAMWASINSTGHWRGEIWNRRKNGEAYAELLTINTIRNEDGSVHRRVALFSDITDKKDAEALILNQANYDQLTQLPNRRLFHDRLQQEIRKAQREGQPTALLYIDLDRFKEVNDTLGHEVGDLLLVEAAKRIRACVRDYDTVARLGGDEFTVILAELAEASDIGRIAQSIIDGLTKPFSIKGRESFVSASIGIALYPEDATSAGDLLKNADQAMYRAKEDGRGRYQFFTRAMQESSEFRMRMGNDLRCALGLGQLEVVYQPIVTLGNGRIDKAEALLRWNHRDLGQLYPDTFISIAEDTGTIHEIGDWVFVQAAKQARKLGDILGKDFKISVNKSPVQLSNCRHPAGWWHDTLEALGVPGDCIVVEITDGLLMYDNANVAQILLQFRDAGIQVSIDDFGTGYSALSYLKKFDVDYLKIDKSFVRNLALGSEDFALCEAIVMMAHSLGLKVIAEGVETERQHELLNEISCDYGQGYLYGRPVSSTEFEKLIRQAR